MATACYESLRNRSVLVTGATGKVGRHLVFALLDLGAQVSILTRNPDGAKTLWPSTKVECRVGDLCDLSSLADAVAGNKIIFHLASYAPAPDAPDIYEAPEHWRVSAEGTHNLLAAVQGYGGIRRLVYMSSVKVMGDKAGGGDHPADERTAPLPDSLYGRAKLEAERLVIEANRAQGLATCVLRLPMVYGLEGQGNIARMIEAIARHRFPSWPRIENKRSAIHINDVIQAALLAATHPAALGQVFLLSDGRTYSTRYLYEQIRLALGWGIPRWTLPLWILVTLAEIGSGIEKMSGKAMPLTREKLNKLTGNAWFSADKIHEYLGYEPHHHMSDEIPLMVRRYCHSRSPQLKNVGIHEKKD